MFTEDEGGDEFGSFMADNVGAKEFARLGVEDGFDEAVRCADSEGFAVGLVVKFADFDGEVLRFGGFFGEAGATNLGGAVGAAGNVLVV